MSQQPPRPFVQVLTLLQRKQVLFEIACNRSGTPPAARTSLDRLRRSHHTIRSSTGCSVIPSGPLPINTRSRNRWVLLRREAMARLFQVSCAVFVVEFQPTTSPTSRSLSRHALLAKTPTLRDL